MAEAAQIRFDDGAAYEGYMGRWSQLAGDIFLDWLAPAGGQRWIEVGCGNGAFTERLVERCAPSLLQGIDPSENQLRFARTRPATRQVQFQLADAMALPFADDEFDMAVMALVIFFVPEPARGVAEMVRVVRPGGTVAAYAWDILGGGFPFAAVQDEMRALGIVPLQPPRSDASRIDALHALWTDSGLTGVQTREIVVERTFDDFDSFWRITQTGPNMVARLATMTASDRQLISDRLRARLPSDAMGRITYSARANAVKGRVPV
jgi:SAM-dependent methyltransferase